MTPGALGYCPDVACGLWIVIREQRAGGCSRCAAGHVVPSADVHAAPLVQRAREAAAEAERRALRAEGAAAERAAIIAALRAWAEDGGDPWMAHCADRIAAGEHLPPAGGPK